METKTIKINVRLIRLGDLPRVCAINEEMLAENYPWAIWKGIFDTCKPYSFVAVVGHTIVGYVYCDGELVISVAVLAAYQGYGIGRQLMTNCLASCAMGKETRLQVRTTNTSAIKLYESLGFIIQGQIADYYKNPECDAHLMVHAAGQPHTATAHIKCTRRAT